MTLLRCYNRGCGKEFNEAENNDDSCRHHPGVPFFHDAYKGWSCCNKKSVDFTEFLNIKGCTLSKHSNVKPPEPEKPPKSSDEEIKEEAEPQPTIRAPIAPKLQRPSLNSPLVKLEPTVTAALKQQIDALQPTTRVTETTATSEIAIGTACKNSGCNRAYESPATNDEECVHHPGVPIFHEGMKYWSCCQRKTSDFTAFMSQPGCERGRHKWVKEENAKEVKCRWDWHQTPDTVIVTFYAKGADYRRSWVKLNPVRLAMLLVFPQQNDAEFVLDMELKGIVSVENSKVQMTPNKVELTMPKVESGSWQRLDVPKKVTKVDQQKPVVQQEETKKNDDDSDVDLDDLEAMGAVKITEVVN